jgi:hypothetical protein
MMQIATVPKTAQIPSILYVQELMQQPNSPQTDIHVKEFKYNSCGQNDTTFTMEIESYVSKLLTFFSHLIWQLASKFPDLSSLIWLNALKKKKNFKFISFALTTLMRNRRTKQPYSLK